MIFRLSQKLATKLKEGNLPAVPLDENPYADWSAHLFTVARTQYIIVANTRALYSVVIYGKGITDYSEFISRALSACVSSWNTTARASSTSGSSLQPAEASVLPRRWIAP